VPKIDVFYRFYYKKMQAFSYVYFLISGFDSSIYQGIIMMMERSDSTILGILGILAHFRHIPA